MVDFATLVLAADSRGLVTGEQALNSLASTAERTENRTGKALTVVGKATEQVGKQSVFAGQQSRMLAMQLSQVAQQASATGNWVQALAIQLPDMALGFGTIGIAAGVAAGAILPVIANMMSAGEEAEDLADAVSGLKDATEAYESATQNASMSAGDLIDKFGQQAVAAQEVYDVLRRLAELNFYEALRKQQEAVSESLGELTHSLDAIQGALEFPDTMANQKLDEIRVQTENLAVTFGLTVGQANEIRDALDELGAANGPAEAADAALKLSDAIDKAAEHGAKIPPEMREAQKAALEAAEQSLRFSNLIGGAIPVANSLAVAMGGVANEAQRAAQFAAALTGRYPSRGTYAGVDRSADGAIQGESIALPSTGPVPAGRGRPELGGFPWEKFGGGGGGRGRRGGGGGGKSQAELYEDLIKDAERRIASLTAEREAVGLSEQAAEKLRSETEMLNDAQQKGIKLTDDQKANISSLAEQMGTLEEETRRAEEQMDFFNDISDDLKDGLLDAILAGEDLDDVFKDLAKTIAKAALEAALFGTGPMAGGGGSGGGWLGGLFKLFSFEGGGNTGSGSRSGGMDGKGGYLAMVHPQETIIDHANGNSAAGGGVTKVEVVSRFDANGNFESNVERISSRVSSAHTSSAMAQIDKALPGKIADAVERTG